MKKRYVSICSSTLVMMLAGVSYGNTPPPAGRSFFVDNPRSYPSGTCSSNLSDKGDRTGGIRSGLTEMGWAGQYWTGSDAWANDFIDSAAEDADTFDLAIFDGHGNTDVLGFAYPNEGVCYAGNMSLTGETNVRMGTANHAKAAVSIFATCCFVSVQNPDAWRNTSAGNQIMGFGGLSDSNVEMLNNFWNSSGGSNLNAWLSEMEDRPGWFSGDNTVVVFTHGWTPEEVITNRSTCGLKRGTCWGANGYLPSDPWSMDWKQHGCGGCIGC